MLDINFVRANLDLVRSKLAQRGEAIYELDRFELEEAGPDLIVTQAVCEVCAVSFDDVRAVAERLPTQPDVISLDPSTLVLPASRLKPKPALASRS